MSLAFCSIAGAEGAQRPVSSLPVSSEETSQSEQNFLTLEKGVHSGITKPLQTVVRSEEEWNSFWSFHAAAMLSRPVPFVDFSEYIVAGVFAGQKPSGGYEVEITGIEAGNNSLNIYYKETAPSAGQVVTMVMSQPFHIIKIKKSDAEVNFKKTEAEEGNE